MGLLLPFLQLLLLQSPRPSPRLMLMPTCTEDMVGMDWDTLAMEDTMDMVLAMVDIMDMVLDTATMESVRLKLSHICMVVITGMVLYTVDTMDMVLVLDTAIMESVRLSPRLMLMLICMEDTMDMVLDTVDTMAMVLAL